MLLYSQRITEASYKLRTEIDWIYFMRKLYSDLKDNINEVNDLGFRPYLPYDKDNFQLATLEATIEKFCDDYGQYKPEWVLSNTKVEIIREYFAGLEHDDFYFNKRNISINNDWI